MWPLLWPFKRARSASSLSATSSATGPCYIAALPTELLAVILVLAGKANWPAIRLVCKAWNQALVVGGLWKTFTLEPSAPLLSGLHADSAAAAARASAWLASKLALLQRVASHVQALVVRNGSAVQALAGGAQLQGCLVVPQLAALRGLRIAVKPRLSQRLLNSILRFQQLTELRISSGGHLPANAAAVVAGLPGLHSLQLSASQLGEPLLAAVLQLTALTALSLGSSRQPLFAWALLHLPSLSNLRAVSLAEGSSEAHEQAAVQQFLAAFPRLLNFEYACSRQEGGLQLPGCGRLQACKVTITSPPVPAAATVELGAIGLASLSELLTFLVPTGIPLRFLTFRRGSASAAALEQRCTALSTLTALALDGVSCAPSLEAGLAALLSQAPLLADLSLARGARHAMHGSPRCPALRCSGRACAA